MTLKKFLILQKISISNKCFLFTFYWWNMDASHDSKSCAKTQLENLQLHASSFLSPCVPLSFSVSLVAKDLSNQNIPSSSVRPCWLTGSTSEKAFKMPCIPLPYISIWKWLGPWCSCVHTITSSGPPPQRCPQDQRRHGLVQTTIHALFALKNKPTKNLGLGNMGARFDQSRSALGWGSDYSQGPGMTNIYITKGPYESWETQTCSLMLNKRALENQPRFSQSQTETFMSTNKVYLHA